MRVKLEIPERAKKLSVIMSMEISIRLRGRPLNHLFNAEKVSS